MFLGAQAEKQDILCSKTSESDNSNHFFSVARVMLITELVKERDGNANANADV